MRIRTIGVVVAIASTVAFGHAFARRRPDPCSPARYFVDDGVILLAAGKALPRDVLAFGESIDVLSGCPPVPLGAHVTRHGTRINVRFEGCTGLRGRARLKGVIDTSCEHLRATFRARRDHLRTRFTATRSVCGDGIFDPAAGEGCDAGEGCASCADCTCIGATSTTTTTTLTTTTCVPEPPVLPALRVMPVNAIPAAFAPFAVQPPGSSDWYLAEQRGRILIVRDGQILATPFLDVEGAMGVNFGERGLLSIAFHPSYAQNGRFFTMGTPSESADGTYAPFDADAIVEWARDPADPDKALPTKVRDIVVLPASDDNHNGGTILFGPDGYLYAGTGDGGGGCESAKPGAVQDPTKLFGKILRLDVDGAPPFAAPGNPFGADARVYHYGLRNPFRFNFDFPTGDLFIGDVGQDSYEEISVVPGNAPGRNFGWPAFEGTVQGTCGTKPLGGPSPHTPPIVSIDRRNGSSSPFADYSSIIGGRVYRGAAIPALQGIYLFADFGAAELGALRFCNGQTFGPVALPLSAIPTPSGGLSAISSFVQGTDGELYVTYGFSTRIGKIEPQ